MERIEINAQTGERTVVPLTVDEIADAGARTARENSPEKIQARLVAAVQRHLDAKARERGYDSIFTASTYATSLHLKFGPEGIAYRDWRDKVWDYCYVVLADVQAGLRSIPTEAELLAELPAPVLP